MSMSPPSLTVAFSTWNVGAAAGSSSTAFTPGVDAWIKAGSASSSDVHVVVLQEVIDINSVLSYAANPFAAGSLNGLDDVLSTEPLLWEAAICAALPTHALVARKQLVGMVLWVLVSEKHKASCSSARVASIGTGALGAGNKGAVAASLTLYGSTIAFVGSHLAAGSKGAC